MELNRDKVTREVAFRETTRFSSTLSDRERVIIWLLSQGKAHKEIAALLHLSTQTVKNEASMMYAKLDAVNAPHAVYIVFH